MNILCLGDVHMRASTPRARVDNYAEAQLDKIDQAHNVANEHGCDYIIAPGDVFDTATPPFGLVGVFLNKIIDRGGWLAVLGQHDQRYHSNQQENTPLGLLKAARALHILKPEKLRLDPQVDIYGASWGQDIPDIEDSEALNILVMHRMVVGSVKLWREQQDFMWSRHVLRRHNFDLIVTGDNHQFFTDSVPGPRWLVNCGSLMRSSIDQVNHKPTVVVYNTLSRTIGAVPLRIAPARRVFDMQRAKVEKEKNEMLESFVAQMGSEERQPDLDFLSTLGKLAKGKGISKGVAEAVNTIVELSDGS